jgi:hypothetical protein
MVWAKDPSSARKAPDPPIATSEVAVPPAPAVPMPYHSILFPSLNANSAFSAVVGAELPVLLLILIVFAIAILF